MAGVTEPAAPPWGVCRFCGVAVAAGATHCGICGAADPLPAADVSKAPRPVRRWVRLTHGVRVLAVVVVVVGLAYALIPAALSGPPNVPDPLTTSGVYSIAAGGFVLLTGEMTGGDYVVGNYSTMAPAGTSLQVAVYNATGWSTFVNGTPAAPAWSIPAQPGARIIFSAPYTDTYYFVFENPYPAASGVKVTAYIGTQYESNVGADGFG
jgi:hypothetical protein